jgi:hypothetical protein
MTDSGWRKRQIALDKKAENARELGLDYEVHSCSPFCDKPMCVADAVKTEREACAKMCEDAKAKIWEYHTAEMKDAAGNVCINLASAIRARGQPTCTHEWIDATTTKPQWHCAKCGKEYTKETEK